MGRTKWKNRTKAEQERILKDQQDMKNDGRKSILSRALKSTFDAVAVKEINDQGMNVYNSGSIPILCSEDGWAPSEYYVIIPGKSPFYGNECNYLHGKCKTCGKDIKRALPTGTTEFMLFELAVTKLTKEGRLIDRR